jgi:uncharacterized protein YbjT (DUF2867 family)
MPVLVTGAECGAGRAIVQALLRSGGEVRVFVDPLDAPADLLTRLRARGCKVARGTLDDEGLLELALEHVHTLVHAAADPLAEPAAVVDDLSTAVSAALGAGCRRLVFLSHLGAGEPRGSAWLEACAEAEELLAEAPLETVVIRRALTYGADDELTGVLADTTAGAVPDAMHNPLWVEDLAAAVCRADARDRDLALGHLVVPLGGPELISLAEFVALLGGQVSDAAPGGPLPEHTRELLSRDLYLPQHAPRAGTPPSFGAEAVRDALTAR